MREDYRIHDVVRVIRPFLSSTRTIEVSELRTADWPHLMCKEIGVRLQFRIFPARTRRGQVKGRREVLNQEASIL